MERICAICSKSYLAKRQNQKYCSRECRLEADRRRFTKVALKLPPSTIGTLSELRVAIDLLNKKYEVFRAMSPSCSCDLAILKGGKLLRIEVTTGHYYTGKIKNGLVANAHQKKSPKYDILAVVSQDGKEIIYYGDLD